MKENREQLRLLIGQASQRLHEFWERADRTRLLVILGLVGMGIILCSELLPSGATGQEAEQLSGEEVCGQSDSERYVRSIEERLTQILSQIDGAGECSVMVTLRESSRSVYASEDKSTTQTSQGQQNTQNTSSSEQKLVLVESRDGQSSPVIEKIVEFKDCTEEQKKTKASDHRFYHYALQYLREEFPSKTEGLTDEEIKEILDKGLRAAHFFHFSTEADAMGFIDIDLRLEQTLSEEEPPLWAKKILRDSTLTNEEKLYRLRDAYCTLEWLEHTND